MRIREGIADNSENRVFVASNPIALAPDAQVAGLVDDFLASQRAPRTRESYALDLATFLRWLSMRDTHPLQVARPDVDRYRNWLSELVGPDGAPVSNGRARYAPATVARRLSAVRAFYSYLADQRVLPASPAAGVKSPTVRREPRGRAITDTHVKALLATATERGAQEEAIVCLLVLNGLRVSEICRLDIEDMRREPGGGHSLIVRGKGAKEVTVALNERTERALLTAIGARTSGPLFRRQDRRRTRHGASAAWQPFNRQAIARLLTQLARRADLVGAEPDQIDRLYPHRLRHTFVTMLLDRGVPLPQTQDAARHASADTTRLYDRSRAGFREHPTHLLAFE